MRATGSGTWLELEGVNLRAREAEAVEGVHSQDGVWKNKLHTAFYFRGFFE